MPRPSLLAALRHTSIFHEGDKICLEAVDSVTSCPLHKKTLLSVLQEVPAKLQHHCTQDFRQPGEKRNLSGGI